MKKITFIFCLLATAFGYAQTIVEDFDPVRPGTAFFQDNTDGTVGISQVADPAVGGTRGNVLRLATAAGAPWQGAGLILQTGFELDLTDDPTDPDEKKVKIWVYSSNGGVPFNFLAKVTNGGPVSATDATHSGNAGWEELTFDFAVNKDGTAEANGIYSRIIFFPGWRTIAPCTSGCYPDNPIPNITMFIDEISYGVPNNTTWTGNGDTNTNWDTAANWTNGVPNGTLEAIIPNLTNDPIASGAVLMGGMSIEPDAAVTINGAVTNTGTITVSSGASFIAQTSVSGTVTYERNLISSNWHYISSPVIGQDVDNFVAASGLQSGGTDISLCTFDTTANYWDFYQDGTNNADVLNEGQGYIVNLTAASGDISFTGTMNVDNETIALATTGEGYNLLGNPYTSYINSGAMLFDNSASLFSQTIWVWDQSVQSYITQVSGDNFQLAPGQGFFIQSNGVAGNVVIDEGYQSHQGTDTFLRSADRTEVYLSLSDGSSIKECKLYYIEGKTTGFDNGYDGPMFRAFSEPLSIYTHLVTNGFGRDFGVQSLPNDDYENLIIPVGVNATAGAELSISASAINLPIGIDIYLEDRDADTFTLLSATSDFTFTPTTDLDGIGRFYLYTSSSTLGLNENVLESNLQIYTTDSPKELVIKGQLSAITIANLYDVQGKLVLSKELEQFNNSNNLDISSLSSGLYVVKVEGGNLSKTQKILIK